MPIFIAPTRLPHVTKKNFADAGISHTIFANQGLRAAHAAMDRAFGVLAKSESAEAVGSEISPVSTVASLVGAQKVVELEALLSKTNGKPGAAQKRQRATSLSGAGHKVGVSGGGCEVQKP
jgi:2-methylisocitrate lyase-like PEP mutase family enzyme